MSEGTEWQAYSAASAISASDDFLVRRVSVTPPAAGTVERVTAGNLAPALVGLAANVVQVPVSGDSSGAADVTAINNVTGNGGIAQLAWTGASSPYYVSSPLILASQAGIRGAQPWMASQVDNYGTGNGGSGGTVVKAVSGFSGAAAVSMSNATVTQYYGVNLQDFTLDLFSASGSVHGILVDGAWGAGLMSGVAVNSPPGDCLHFRTDSTSNFSPDDWRVSNCKFSWANGYGVYSDNLPDSWFIGCEASVCGLDNWYLGSSLNTKLIGCKGENSTGGAGFHLGGQFGGGRALSLIGCGTHLNNKDGFLFDDTSAGAAGGVYILSGCYSGNDGQAGGTTYAGYRSSASVNRVTATGCTAYGAAYGASQVSGSAGMTFTGCDISGTTASFHDDGSNTLTLAGIAPSNQQVNVTLATTFNSATGTGAQNVTGMAVVLQPGAYVLRGRLWYTAHGTTGSTQTFAWTFGGTASAAQVSWQFLAASYTPPVSGTSLTTSSGLSPALTATTYPLDFAAHAVVTVAGALQLTVQSTTSGDEVSVLAGSVLDIEPVAA